ncbi:MAG: hypothetical protein KZQ92_10080 [Candidatus Thiodiazotropha sp. (ex Lucinoma borealis)]|nr:hypothetical protein [Candidatus Thiodiazotropha sp. (ex Lucinoma borealis)]
MKRLRNIIAQILIIFIASTISACAEIYKKPSKDPDSANSDNFVYSINFDSKSGGFVIRNEDGKAIEGKPVNFPQEPLPVDAIINVHTIIEAKGSCLVIFNGRVYNVCFR